MLKTKQISKKKNLKKYLKISKKVLKHTYTAWTSGIYFRIKDDFLVNKNKYNLSF